VLASNPTESQFRMLAASGPSANLAHSNLQISPENGLIGRVLAEQKTCFQADFKDLLPLEFGGQVFASAMVTPLNKHRELVGMIILADQHLNALNQADIPLVETAAVQLVNVWSYSQYNETLTEFIQSATLLSAIQDTESLMNVIASIARRTLKANFTLVATFNNQEWMLRAAGRAPMLVESLRNGAMPFLEEAIRSPYTFRLKDLRTDERSSCINLDEPELRTLLASPIRVNGNPIGLLLAFGKLEEEAFSEADAFLAELLSSQAAVTLESSHLNQELRTNLKTTQLLYDLSLHIAQAEDLSRAAYVIAKTAYHLFQAQSCGLLLFAPDGAKEAEVRFPTTALRIEHPHDLVRQAMESRQIIYMADNDTRSMIAIPIQTMRRCYGALWLALSEGETAHPTEEIRILINQASVALERSILLAETRQQANELVRAYNRLERSYDQFLEALMKALDARDQATEGHSERVKMLAVALGQDMGLSKAELRALERGALLHDIGKIGVPDGILKKTGPLDPDEWVEMRKHPSIGARIVQEIPALQDSLPVIAYHQERWDGSGYPMKLSGTDIPMLARIFAAVDVFDALTSNRPYRKSQTPEEALAYLESQCGVQFDENVVTRLARIVRSASTSEQEPGQSEIPQLPALRLPQ
jgi:putative nucleotidyltransferase with HDIG domain